MIPFRPCAYGGKIVELGRIEEKRDDIPIDRRKRIPNDEDRIARAMKSFSHELKESSYCLSRANSSVR